MSSAVLYGGWVLAGGTSTNNSLNIYTKNVTARNIGYFQNLNFYLPEDTVNGDTILTLTQGMTDLTNTSIKAGVAGNANLSTGDSVTLLKNANGIMTDSTTTYGTLSEGVSLNYDLTVEKADDTSIVARIGNVSNQTDIPVDNGFGNVNRLTDQTEAVGQTPVVTMQVVKTGFDRLIDWLPPEDFGMSAAEDSDEVPDAPEEEPAKLNAKNGFEVFANMGGSSLRTKTGNGSHVDTKSGGMDIGAARTLENSKGKLTFAPIIDYGRGNYDTYLGNGIHGSGSARYWAGGMIARQTNDNGFYYEGSFRVGRTDTDFASNDFMQAGNPVRFTYDVSSRCYAGHIRAGQLYRIGPRDTAHFYGIYSFHHIGSATAELSTGESYYFSPANSGLLRIGGRLMRQINEHSRVYSGLAYQYEFSGESDAVYKGYTTPGSSTRGSSGMIELGWQIKPTKESPIMLDINATGWVGMQKGVGVQLQFKQAF